MKKIMLAKNKRKNLKVLKEVIVKKKKKNKVLVMLMKWENKYSLILIVDIAIINILIL